MVPCRVLTIVFIWLKENERGNQHHFIPAKKYESVMHKRFRVLHSHSNWMWPNWLEPITHWVKNAFSDEQWPICLSEFICTATGHRLILFNKKSLLTKSMQSERYANNKWKRRCWAQCVFTWTIIAIWRAPCLIVCRHFSHLAFSAAYETLYGNASFIFSFNKTEYNTKNCHKTVNKLT